MKVHHIESILKFNLAVIGLGILALVYFRFLDGTIINPVERVDAPEYNLGYASTYFTPLPQGDILGTYFVDTDQTSYYPGDTVYEIISLCHFRDITPIVQWSFANDIVASLPSRPGNLTNVGCYINEKIPIGKVPDELSSAFPDSKYRLHGIVTFQVNPFRKLSYLIVSDYFTINKR